MALKRAWKKLQENVQLRTWQSRALTDPSGEASRGAHYRLRIQTLQDKTGSKTLIFLLSFICTHWQ